MKERLKSILISILGTSLYAAFVILPFAAVWAIVELYELFCEYIVSALRVLLILMGVCIGIALLFLLVYILVSIVKYINESMQKKTIRIKENKLFDKQLETTIVGNDFREYHKLAEMYEKGIGTDISLRQALIYYRKAAELGDAKEKRAFGKRFEKGDHIAREIDMEEAQRWYDAADKWEQKYGS